MGWGAGRSGSGAFSWSGRPGRLHPGGRLAPQATSPGPWGFTRSCPSGHVIRAGCVPRVGPGHPSGLQVSCLGNGRIWANRWASLPGGAEGTRANSARRLPTPPPPLLCAADPVGCRVAGPGASEAYPAAAAEKGLPRRAEGAPAGRTVGHAPASGASALRRQPRRAGGRAGSRSRSFPFRS